MYKKRNNIKTKNKIDERLLNFAVDIIKLIKCLPKTEVGRHIGGQLIRSGTSSGANYEEARGAESRSDFIHKLGITLKEMKESRFWLRLIKGSELLKSNSVNPILKECEELCAIIAKSILTARKKK
jgi:four helix bundle protein